MKSFTVHAEFDAVAGVWWASNDGPPLTTEAPTFDKLMARVLEIAPEIAAANGVAEPGEELQTHFTADRTASIAG